MNKVVLFIDTESTIFNGKRVVYDVSLSCMKLNVHNSKVPFKKFLRNRTIDNSDRIITPIYENNMIIEEFKQLIPSSKETTYGYAQYNTYTFKNAMEVFKIVCNYYKPDAIVGYNFQADFDAIKSTQTYLKTSDIIYSNNPKLPNYKLFKKNECNSFDNAFKTDLMLYLISYCPNFMKYQEDFTNQNKITTQNGYLSQKLIDMYRYTVQNVNIEQLHMGYYDNMFAIEVLEKALVTDGFQQFPINCFNTPQKKRKRYMEEEAPKENINNKRKFMHLMDNQDVPSWFDDKLRNSKCSKTENIEDIRRFHPHYGGSNKETAPYFRGSDTRAGIWPPPYAVS